MSSHGHIQRGKGFRPRLESLEDRLCLSVTVTTIALQNGKNELRIVGDSAADTVNIADLGNGHMDVTDGGGATLGSADNVSLLRFNGKNGTDTVNYTLVNTLAHNEAINFYLGSGGDGHATLDLSQGLNGAKLVVGVEGSLGNDTISAIVGSLSASSHANFYIEGGAGNDNISVTGATAPINTGTASAKSAAVVEGGLSIGAGSTLRTEIYGGLGNDTINFAWDGQILGKLVYGASGGPGADTLTGNITAAAGSTGLLRASETGGPGIDSVTLNVFDNSGDGASTLASLHATIFNPSAVDTLVHTDNVKVIQHH